MTAKDRLRAGLILFVWIVALAWVVWITRYLSVTATLLGCLGISWLVIYLARGLR